DPARVARSPQRLGCGIARRAAAHDDDRARPVALRREWARPRTLHLLRDDRLAAPPLDVPAGERLQRRRVLGLAGAQAETGVMPWTTDGVVHHESFGARTAVVRARG